MADWKTCLQRGEEYLESRRPSDAVHCFEQALRECPNDDSRGMAMVLFYCGLTLEKLGATDGAVRCWRSAADYDGNNPSHRMLDKYSETSGNMKDREYHTFAAVQTAKYFQRKGKEHFDSQQEHRELMRVVDAYWIELEDSGILDLYPAEDLFYLFYEIQIDFSRWIGFSSWKGKKILKFRTDGRG